MIKILFVFMLLFCGESLAYTVGNDGCPDPVDTVQIDVNVHDGTTVKKCLFKGKVRKTELYPK